MLNLDHASHTVVDEAVLAEFCRVEREYTGNAMSKHKLGQAARDELSRAVQGITQLLFADFMHSEPQILRAHKDSYPEIIFTSGASEANNLAIKGLTRAYAHTGKHILSTCLEHPSVSGTLAHLAESDYKIELLKILPNGKIDLAHLKNAIRPDTVLLCVSAVDSELGAIQPLEDIAEIVSQHPNCHLHIDAAQAIGKIAVPTESLAKSGNFSTLCFSPHKFHGLCGFGVLIKRKGVVLEPLIHGGSGVFDEKSEKNEKGGAAYGGGIYRSGTPSPALSAACFLALQKALTNQSENLKTVKALRDYVLKNLPPTAKINSPSDGSPYILNLSINGIRGTTFQSALNDHGIAVSVKSACSTDNAPSRPVFAVSGDKKNALNSWRVSFSNQTTIHELDAFLSAVHAII
ncbi:MAG: aminotransferase class V-fold PLP-dependent enzyme [Defluviitaleaceae bacterium]|nr:aminotransferase class V-fold PLP-dependent enzyme [Defluviitaleaceae bacterium]